MLFIKSHYQMSCTDTNTVQTSRRRITSVLNFVAQWDGFAPRTTAKTLKRIDSAAIFDAARASGTIGCHHRPPDSDDHVRALKTWTSFDGLGQRVSQLTYNAASLIATDPGTPRRGLSIDVVAIVQRMNLEEQGSGCSALRRPHHPRTPSKSR